MLHPHARRPLLLLVPALVLAACDGGTDPQPEYRPEETVARLDAVVGPLLDSENAFAALAAAGDALVAFSAEPAAALLLAGPAAEPRTGSGALRRTRHLWSTRMAFPAAIVDRTLVWSTAEGRYVVSETRTDAPEGGVRFVYYAMNPATGFPVEPLVELGHIDLTDEDVADQERLGIRVVDSGAADVVLLDYYVGFSGYAQASEGDVTFTAAGALSDGTTTVQFDLLQSFRWNEALDSESLSLAYEYVADGTVRFLMEATGAFEAPPEQVDLLVEVVGGGETVAFEAAITAGGALSGGIRVNGTTVIDIGGADGSPIFTRTDGRSLTQEDRAALQELWSLVVDLLVLTEGLFSPAALLLLNG
ncbi:MAG TPA: hypothetical protein VMM12_13630 [Longimicrobiales bacterium]|nr:hypothetical protein [Longimicrobiales bacterium]